MILGTGCLGAAALDADAIEAALSALGLAGALLVGGADRQPQGSLAALPVHGVRVTWDEAPAGVALAARAGTTLLVLDPPEEIGLEEACRALFDLVRSQGGGLAVALRGTPTGSLASAEALGAVLEDLSSLRVGYWHRPAACVLRGESEESALDALGRWLVGVSLDDVAAGQGGLPPGVGEIDLSRSAALAARSVALSLDVDAVPDVSLLRVALDSLHAAGFP